MAGEPEIVVVAGLSGAGRSTAANALEDLGWFVVDNLPPSLISDMAELAQLPGSAIGKLALVVGTHRYHGDLMPAIEELREGGARLHLVFLEASTEVLVRRFDDTRRRHPLGEDAASVIEAIERERALLQPVKVAADMVIDTDGLIVHDLKSRVVDAFRDVERDQLMRTTVTSFGYKNGVPRDADLVFDCRFLPNPHWVPDLRPLSGLDEPVRAYVLGQESTADFLDRLLPLLDMLLPSYVGEGKAYLTIALGCTGGRHRSVAMAERLSEILQERGHEIRTRHRDIGQ